VLNFHIFRSFHNFREIIVKDQVWNLAFSNQNNIWHEILLSCHNISPSNVYSICHHIGKSKLAWFQSAESFNLISFHSLQVFLQKYSRLKQTHERQVNRMELSDALVSFHYIDHWQSTKTEETDAILGLTQLKLNLCLKTLLDSYNFQIFFLVVEICKNIGYFWIFCVLVIRSCVIWPIRGLTN